jgi:hypothetical protein
MKKEKTPEKINESDKGRMRVLIEYWIINQIVNGKFYPYELILQQATTPSSTIS